MAEVGYAVKDGVLEELPPRVEIPVAPRPTEEPVVEVVPVELKVPVAAVESAPESDLAPGDGEPKSTATDEK
jgi:hypothetical protein